MPSIFSKLKGKDGLSKSKSKKATLDGTDSQPQKPRWEDAYTRKTVDAEEVQELISRCTEELKARGMKVSRIAMAPVYSGSIYALAHDSSPFIYTLSRRQRQRGMSSLIVRLSASA